MTTKALTLTSNYFVEDTDTITEELLSAYEQQLDVKDSTKKTYINCVRKFIDYLNENNIDVVTYEILVAYKNYLKEHTEIINNEVTTIKHKTTTINTHITAVKDLFKFLERKGFKNVAKAVKKERTDNNFKREVLTKEQVEDILNSIDVNTIEGARAYALFKLLIGTGLRECEVIRADINDLTTKGNTNILKVQGKGATDKDNFVIIQPSVMRALQHYFKLRGNVKGNDPLFTSVSDRNKGQRLTTRTIQRIVKGLYADNGIFNENITTHSTRHTAITLSILNGASVHKAQEMARHKDINTTMIYFHNLDRLENNAESILENLFNS